jgi:dihydrofolate reductase
VLCTIDDKATYLAGLRRTVAPGGAVGLLVYTRAVDSLPEHPEGNSFPSRAELLDLVGIGAEVMGAAMFGLHTYGDDPDWKGWWGDEPPFGTPVYVLTHTAPRPTLPMAGGTTFHFRSGAIHEALAEAKEAAGDQDVRIGGGVTTARDFLRADLVDDLHLMIAPILLGRGERLWDGLSGLDRSHLVATELADSGTIHVTFTRA